MRGPVPGQACVSRGLAEGASSGHVSGLRAALMAHWLLWLMVAILMVPRAGRADEGVIRQVLPKAFPGMPGIDEVRASPIPGLWAVRAGGQIVYTTGDASILLEGQMVDVRTRSNLTREALDKALAVDFDTLPLQDALITFRHGTGARAIAVFADPTCAFCKRFEPTLHQMENVTVYTFVVAMLGPQAADLATRLLCAKEPALAWNAWMLKGEQPVASTDCQPPALQRNRALAARVGVTGTPTTLLVDRSRLAGAVPADVLRASLEKAAAGAKAGKSQTTIGGTGK